MARYVMANRRAGKFTKEQKLRSREAIESSFHSLLVESVEVIQDLSGEEETSRRSMLFEADPKEIEAKKLSIPEDVMIEREILHYPATALPLDISRMAHMRHSNNLNVEGSENLNIKVTAGNKPAEGASVLLFLRGSGGAGNRLEGVVNANGQVSFQFNRFWNAAALVIYPIGGFWSLLVRAPKNGQKIALKKLPKTGYTAWWHRLHGVNNYNIKRGYGIKVGVIDTGLGPHQNLNHASDEGAYIDGFYDATSGNDSDSHGTHVSGIIGARPQNPGELAGISPGVDLFSVRVFPKGRGANQLDIANAIDHLSKKKKCDLINLSLGSKRASELAHDSIIDAFERGTLCICAAANDGEKPVNYPARFEETIAISALGFTGWGPDSSLSAMNYPNDQAKYGVQGVYLASFSNFGKMVDGAGGGVGVISTVPERFNYVAPYAAMDGTSMASPAACGALAAILSKYSNYGTMPRDTTRALKARALFAKHALDVGLQPIHQGKGVPNAN